MEEGRVLVVFGDESIGSPIGKALEKRGHIVTMCSDARTAFSDACAFVPRCIVCALELPDIDGLWLTRRIRTEIGPVSRTPMLVIGELTDPATRMQTLKAGADAFIDRPMSEEEIAIRVGALLAMADRLRVDAEAPPSSVTFAAAIRGDIAMFPIASILMMFELERRTGTLEVRESSGANAKLVLSNGLFATTEVDGVSRPAVDVLREVLAWRQGKFLFRPRNSSSIPPPKGSVGALVLEAMRLDDEHRAKG